MGLKENLYGLKIIGVDLGGTKLHVGLVQEKEVVKRSNVILPRNILETNAEAVISVVVSEIAQVCEEGVKAIGVGVPSVVDRKNGIIYDVQNIPSWKEIPLKTILEEKFNVPVFIDNDANCFAIGERFYGKGVQYENFVGITLGTGLGGGVINRGKLLDDNNCGSGEFGEMFYLDARVEDYASGQFFKNKHKIAGDELYKKAQKGDGWALQVFNEFGYHLGRVIKMIMCAVDPEAFIIGGSVAKASDYFTAAMWNEISSFTFPRSVEKLKIEFSTTKDSPLLGAAALCLR